MKPIIAFLFILLLYPTNIYCQLKWTSIYNGSGDFSNTWHTYNSDIDKDGNIYTVGTFTGTSDFDPSSNVLNMTGNFDDIFISKLDSNGNLIWVKSINANDEQRAGKIIVDKNNDIYLTGLFKGNVDFDPGPLTFNLNNGSSYFEYFVVKLDSSGNFIWAQQSEITGSTSIGITDIDIDINNNLTFFGDFAGTNDFDPDTSSFTLTNNSAYGSLFLMKWDSFGNFLFVKTIDSESGVLGASAISVDSSNNIYLTGVFNDTIDFNPGLGINYLLPDSNNSLGQSSFLLKVDSSGNYLWAKAFHGEDSRDIAIDKFGNIYMVGSLIGSGDFDPDTSSTILTSTGWSNFYVTKIDSLGNLIWAHSMPNKNSCTGQISIAINNLNYFYLTGVYGDSTDISLGQNSFFLPDLNWQGLFILKYDLNGNLIWNQQIGGLNGTIQRSQINLFNNDILLSGLFIGTVDFDYSTGNDIHTSNFSNDFYLFKIGENQIIAKTIDYNFDNNIIIYPNPSYGNYNITSDNNIKEYTIYSNTGKIIQSKIINHNSTNINLSNYSSGIYFILLKTDKGIIRKKLLLN